MRIYGRLRIIIITPVFDVVGLNITFIKTLDCSQTQCFALTRAGFQELIRVEKNVFTLFVQKSIIWFLSLSLNPPLKDCKNT